MTEEFDPNKSNADGWKVDYDNLGNQVRDGDQWPAYSPETGLPAVQEVDAHGNPPKTEYDALGNVIPLR